MKGKNYQTQKNFGAGLDGKGGNQGKHGYTQYGNSGIAMLSEVEDEASRNAADGKKQARPG